MFIIRFIVFNILIIYAKRLVTWQVWFFFFFSFFLSVQCFYKLLFMSFRVFVVQQIPDSNLLMLVVQADCDCSRQYSSITMEPKEVKYILSHYVILDPAGVSSTQVFYPINNEDNLFQKREWVSSCHCSSLTPSHIMPRLNVTGWGHRRFADGPSPAMPTTPR